MSRTAVATGARGGAAPGKYSETRGDALASARASMQKKFRRPMYAASETIRERLRELQATHVDQVILLNQAGENTHKDICESLELFGKEVYPEFAAERDEREARKADELAPYIEAALARKKWMRELSDDEIPVVPASRERDAFYHKD